MPVEEIREQRCTDYYTMYDEVLLSGTFPVVGSWRSKHQVMVVLGEGGGQALLARAEHLVAPGSALTELPVPSFFIRGRVNGQVLTQDVTATDNVPRLLRAVGKNAPLIAMSTSLKGPSATNVKKTKPGKKEFGNVEERDSPQSFLQAPDSERSPPSIDPPCSQQVSSL